MSRHASEIKRIPIAEFRALGLIQEINRRLLHPMGLAIEVIVDTDTRAEVLGGVWDYRDDPEGMAFADGELEPRKKKVVDMMFETKREEREKNLGYHVQPVEERSER